MYNTYIYIYIYIVMYLFLPPYMLMEINNINCIIDSNESVMADTLSQTNCLRHYIHSIYLVINGYGMYYNQNITLNIIIIIIIQLNSI